MYDAQLEELIDAALIDGDLSEKEKQVLLKKIQTLNIDLDEFEMILNARLYKRKKELNVLDSSTDNGAMLPSSDNNKQHHLKKNPSVEENDSDKEEDWNEEDNEEDWNENEDDKYLERVNYHERQLSDEIEQIEDFIDQYEQEEELYGQERKQRRKDNIHNFADKVSRKVVGDRIVDNASELKQEGLKEYSKNKAKKYADKSARALIGDGTVDAIQEMKEKGIGGYAKDKAKEAGKKFLKSLNPFSRK